MRLFSIIVDDTLSAVVVSAVGVEVTLNTRYPSDGTVPINVIRVPPSTAPLICAGTPSPDAASTTRIPAAGTPSFTVASIASVRSIDVGLYTTSGTPGPEVSIKPETALVALVRTPAN